MQDFSNVIPQNNNKFEEIQIILNNHKYLFMVLIVVLAFSLRIWGLDSRSLWLDEAVEYFIASSDINELFSHSLLGDHNDPPLYMLLLHYWMKISNSEFHLRFFSVLMSMLTVFGTMFIGYRLDGIITGLIAGFLMAILPSEVRYAQDVGQYALIGTFLVFNILALMKIIDKKGTGFEYVLWLLTAIVGTYNYYGAVIPIVIPYSVFMIETGIKREFLILKKLVILLLIYVISITPLLFFFLPSQVEQPIQERPNPQDSISQPPNLEDERSLKEDIFQITDSSADLVAFQFSGYPWAKIPAWLIASVIFLLLSISVIGGTTDQRRFMLWLLASWFVFFMSGKFNLIPYSYRYGIVLTPLLIPATSLGLVKILSKKNIWIFGIVIFIALVTVIVFSLPNRQLRDFLYPNNQWHWPETEDLGTVMEYWLENKREDDITYVYYGAVPAFGYYLQRKGEQTDYLPPTFWYDCITDGSQDYCSDNNIYFGRGIRHFEQDEKIKSIMNTLNGNPGLLWFVFSHVHVDEDMVILEGLMKEYDVVDQFEATGASIYHLSRKNIEG